MRAIMFLFFFLFLLQVRAAEYRSSGSGNWSAAGSWEVFSGSWMAAVSPPGAGDEVLIRSGHSISISVVDALAAVLTIESGATLSLAGTTLALTISDGQVKGRFCSGWHFSRQCIKRSRQWHSIYRGRHLGAGQFGYFYQNQQFEFGQVSGPL